MQQPEQRNIYKGIFTISSWDQHKGWEQMWTHLSSPRADAFRLAPRSSPCSSQHGCWPGQINQQWLGGLQPVSVVIHA